MTISYEPNYADTAANIEVATAPNNIVKDHVLNNYETIVGTTVTDSTTRLTIDFTSDSASVHLSGGGKKKISLADFKTLFLEDIKIPQKTINNELMLPPNVFFFQQNGTSLKLHCFYPEIKGKVKHFTKTHTIPFPKLIISYHLANTKGTKSWTVSAVTYKVYTGTPGQLERPEKLSAMMKQVPFPNFYNDGRMCYGNNTMPHSFTDNDLRGLKYYYDVIFAAPFNNDLGVPGVNISTTPDDWFKYLSEQKTFPYEKLR